MNSSNSILSAIMWREHLSLLPLVIGLMWPGVIWMGSNEDGWFSKTIRVVCTIALLVPFYVGTTGVAAALDVGDIYEKQFAAAGAIAIFQGCLGIFLGYVLYLRPAAQLLDDEMVYSRGLEHTVKGYQLHLAGD